MSAPPTTVPASAPPSIAPSWAPVAAARAVGAEALGDERPVGGAGGVEADVDGRRGEREDDVGARVAERDRDEAARRDDRAADDERRARAAAVAPQPGRERDDEAGGGVDEHHGADEAGPVGDPLEQDRHVGRRDRACGAERDRHGRERPQRDARGARRGRATGSARSLMTALMARAAAGATSAQDVARGGDRDGRGRDAERLGVGDERQRPIELDARGARPRHAAARRGACPSRAAASSRTTSRRVAASRTIASRRPSDGSATGSTRKPNPKNGRLERNTCAAGPVEQRHAVDAERSSWGRNARSSAASARDAGGEVGGVRRPCSGGGQRRGSRR